MMLIHGMFRLLMVVPRCFPYMGGVETHVYEVTRRLAAHGVDVTVLSTDVSGELPAEEVYEGVKILRVRAWPRERDFYFAPQVYFTTSRGDWDIVHCQGIHTLVPPLAMLGAQHANVPFVLTFHSGGHSSRLRHSMRGLQTVALRPLLAQARRLVAVSEFEARLFQKRLRFPHERFAVIPNGSSIPTIPDSVVPDNRLIVSIGRLERYKGHHHVIAALPSMREQHPDIHLRILGSGPYEPTLRQQVRALGLDGLVEIEAIPPGDRHQMALEISRAGVIVLLSEYEAHPIAVMEALSLKRPVLVADTSGLRELAERGLVRAIPIKNSCEQIGAAILDQLVNPLVPDSVVLPTWEDCTDQLLRLYRDVLRVR